MATAGKSNRRISHDELIYVIPEYTTFLQVPELYYLATFYKSNGRRAWKPNEDTEADFAAIKPFEQPLIQQSRATMPWRPLPLPWSRGERPVYPSASSLRPRLSEGGRSHCDV
jgi:hypothetical protein